VRRVGELVSGKEEDGSGDPVAELVVGLGRLGTWPAACACSREADGEGTRLEWRTGRMSGCEPAASMVGRSAGAARVA
jgi:hypothetical protein